MAGYHYQVQNHPNKFVVYPKFLSHALKVRQSSKYPQLDQHEERLMDQLATSWSIDKKITVLMAMRMCDDASASTVHRRLKTLRLKGMLDLQLDADDNRVKYIIPTVLAKSYITELGQSVVMAAGAELP